MLTIGEKGTDRNLNSKFCLRRRRRRRHCGYHGGPVGGVRLRVSGKHIRFKVYTRSEDAAAHHDEDGRCLHTHTRQVYEIS